MRLIIFVKIPEHVDPIPFDIIDDRPTQSVLEDILIITGLSNKAALSQNYHISLNDRKLDLDLSLSQNGIINGVTLELCEKSLDDGQVVHSEERGFESQGNESEITGKKIITRNNQIKDSKQLIPGKKIDFD